VPSPERKETRKKARSGEIVENTIDKRWLWLSLFKAETVEDLDRLKSFGVPEINEAIDAYYEITASSEFREMERMRELARHDEASALRHARDEEREKWQDVVADKDTEIARLRSELDRK
jgi:hypothetical protein